MAQSEMSSVERRKVWQDNHNKRRKDQYNNDPEYRQRRLELARSAYRSEKGVDLEHCLDRIGQIPEYGSSREVQIEGGPVQVRMCLTIAEFGEIIGGHKASVIYRWHSKDLIPRPIATAKVFYSTTGRGGDYWLPNQPVYLAEEVRVMMEHIGKHQQMFKYYSVRAKETIAAVFDAVEAARQNL